MDGLRSSPRTNGVQACLPLCWHKPLPWVHTPFPLLGSWANASEMARAMLGTVTHLQLCSDLPSTVALPTPFFFPGVLLSFTIEIFSECLVPLATHSRLPRGLSQ